MESVTWFIYFLDLFQVRYNCAKCHHCRVCVTDFREGSHPWVAPKKPILNRVKEISRSINENSSSFGKKYFSTVRNNIIAASVIDTGIQKKIHGSGTTTLITSNKEMNGIMKIVQTLEDCNILLKGVTKTIKNKTKEQKEEF